MASGAELIRQVKERIEEVDPRDVRDLVEAGPLVVHTGLGQDHCVHGVPGDEAHSRGLLSGKMQAYCRSLPSLMLVSCPLIGFAPDGAPGGAIGSPVIGFVPWRGSIDSIISGSAGYMRLSAEGEMTACCKGIFVYCRAAWR